MRGPRVYRAFGARSFGGDVPGAARFASLSACPWLPHVAPSALGARSSNLALDLPAPLRPRQVSRVVDRQHAHETIITQLEPRDRAVRVADPDGPQLGGVERAHQVQREDADRAGVTEDC